MKKTIIIPMILLPLFFVFPKVASAATNLSFDSDHQTVEIGQNFTLDIIAQSNDIAFYSADLEISFNGSVVNIIDLEISAGALLDCANGEVTLTNPYNSGTIRAQIFRNDCAPLAVNTATILARLKFRAASVGTTNIKVETVNYRSASSVNETSINKPSVTVSALASDTVNPALSINAITPNPTNTSPITITGAASDNVEVAKVTWSNNRGGNGLARINVGNWTLDAPLEVGVNIITVTATDTSDNTASGTITITYAPAQATVSLNPAVQNAGIGSTFTVTLRVNDVANLDNLTTDILFDSSKISYDHAGISNNIASLNWTADILECSTPSPGCKNLLVKSNLVNLLNGSADIITLYFIANVAGTNNFTYANNHVYGALFNEITSSWNSASATIASVAVISNNCTAFTYSSYSSCASSGTQSRTILTRYPLNCAGGNPESLTRACTYIPSAPAGAGPSTPQSDVSAAPVSGVCGATLKTCAIGAPSNVTDTDAVYYRWNCLGVNNGANTACSLNKSAVPLNATDKSGGSDSSGAAVANATSTPAQAAAAAANTARASATVISFPITNSSLYDKLKGKIILKVQDKGQAYYISPKEKKAYYLGRPQEAFQLIRSQGLGITNGNLEKIPVNLSILNGLDSDSDGLPDAFEEAIGTNKNKADTDGDRYSDKEELAGGFSPIAKGKKMNYNRTLANTLKGKILLQVEHKGEAWYVSPANGQRYFLARPADAFNLMRRLGVGVTDGDYKILGGK